MPVSTTWQEAVLAAGAELGIEGVGAIAARALEQELPLLRDDPDLLRAARSSVIDNVGLVLEVMRGETSLGDVAPRGAAIVFTRELARRNVPVAELDRAYRVAQHALWRWAIGEVRARIADRGAVAEAVEGLSEAAFVTGDVLSALVMERYAAEREQWVRSADAVRRATVEELLTETTTDVDTAARRLRYELRREHEAFVVWSESEDAVPESAAAAVGGARALLVPMSTGVIAGWAPRGAADPDAAPGVPVAVGAPGRGVSGFRRSHREAMEARRVARMLHLPAEPVRYEDVALIALLTKDLAQARDFAVRTLGPLATGDPAMRRLAETLFAVLEEQGSPRRAGRRLGLHENTVAKRMRAVDRLLDPNDRAAPAELLAALTIVRALPSD